MSWDILLLPDHVRLGNPPDWDVVGQVTLEVGHAEFLAALRAACRDLCVDDQGWPVLRRKEFTVEFNMTEEQQGRLSPPVLQVQIAPGAKNDQQFMVVLAAICRGSQLAAYDTSDGRRIDFAGNREASTGNCPKCGRRMAAGTRYCYYCGRQDAQE